MNEINYLIRKYRFSICVLICKCTVRGHIDIEFDSLFGVDFFAKIEYTVHINRDSLCSSGPFGHLLQGEL